MTRAAIMVIFYAVVGTLATMVVYRIALDGPFQPGGDQTLDALIVFITVLLNVALVFGAAGVAATMVFMRSRSLPAAAILSSLFAALIAFAMTFWFPGLTWFFPATVLVVAIFCAGLARWFRLFTAREFRER